MFDYKQRPFSPKITNAEYDRAVGRKPSSTLRAALEILAPGTVCRKKKIPHSAHATCPGVALPPSSQLT